MCLEMVVRGCKIYFRETDGVMHKEGQPPTPIGGLPIFPQEIVLREINGSRRRLQLGLLYSSDFYVVSVEESTEFQPRAADTVRVEL